MILVDTSVWVEHLRVGDRALAELLDSGMVLAHPFVIGELALGDLRQRETVLAAMSDLPRASIATAGRPCGSSAATPYSDGGSAISTFICSRRFA